MKAFIVVIVLFVASLTFSASEGYRYYGPDVLQARPARWGGQEFQGGQKQAGFAETDPDYFPKLFNWLEKVGRR